MLYFAYGSNLDSENWAAWCQDRGFETASIEPVGPAWLPDYEPVFHYQSRLRQGGALDIRPRRGATTPGALFRVHHWAGLDAKEGVSGRFYRRLPVTALTDDGRGFEAVTYTVCDHRVGDFVAPSPEYREIVVRGLARFGHDDASFSAAAAGAARPASPSRIFTYGTLMRGHRSHGLLQPSVRRDHGPARIDRAALVRIDWYPGLVLSPEGCVHGELYEVEDIDTLLETLDEYEDFAGYQRNGSLYRRSLVRATSEGGSMLAWTYVFLGDPSDFPRIEAGRWSDA